MKYVDKGEFYSPKEDSRFFEAISFNNERFDVNENKNDSKEFINIKESINEEEINKNNSSKKTKKDSDNLKELTKKVDKVNNLTHAVSESTAVISASSASVIVTAAAVIVSIASNGSLFTDISKYITNNIGNDYALVDINMNKILNEDEKLYGLKAEDFLIRFDNEGEVLEIEVKEGSHKYLIPNLKINTSYSYDLVCKKTLLGGESSYKKEQFVTTDNSEPKGIFDELNTKTIYDEESSLYSSYYQIYVSDYFDAVSNPVLYVSEEKQDDINNFSSIIYSNEFIEEDNFMKGIINSVKNEKLYFYLTGYIDDEYVLLMEETYNTGIDPNYVLPVQPALVIDENNIDIIMNPDDITVSLFASYIDIDKEFFAYFSTYDEDEQEMSSVLEADFIYNPDNNMISLYSGPLDYGLKYFSYDIYYIDEEDNMIVVYSSGKQLYTGDQSYQATFLKLSPSMVDITYYDSYFLISADVNFTSSYSCFYYELLVVNDDGMIFGSYSGQDKAEIEINDINIGSINFIYNEYGSFNDLEKLYASYNEVGYQLLYPSLSINNEIRFENDYFIIDYNCLMDFDYSSSRIEFYLDNGINTYTYNVIEVKPSSYLSLNQYDGEYGLTSVSAKLYFVDNKTNNQEKMIEFSFGQFDLSYSYTLEKISADIAPNYDSVPTQIGISIYSNYVLPSSYKINITSEDYSINLMKDLSNVTYFNDLAMDSVTTINISIVGSSNNVYYGPFTYTIDPVSVNSNYVSPTVYSVNPGDSVVTYNDDGTINLYRKVNFIQEDNPNVYFNCMIYSSSEVDYATGETIYTNRFDSYADNNYSIIENIPLDTYIFCYIQEFLYNGVYYLMYKETPSGTVKIDFSSISVMVETNGNDTIFNISNSYYFSLDNYVSINGTLYTFDTFDSSNENMYTCTVSNLAEIPSEIYIKASEYSYNYDSYSLDITMKGNKYCTVNLPISKK